MCVSLMGVVPLYLLNRDLEPLQEEKVTQEVPLCTHTQAHTHPPRKGHVSSW